MFSISPRELESEVVFYFKLFLPPKAPQDLPRVGSCLNRSFFPSLRILLILLQFLFFKSTKFNGFLRRVGRERTRSFIRGLCRSLGARHSSGDVRGEAGAGRRMESPRRAAMRRRTIESAELTVCAARESARRRRAQRSATNLTLSGAADRPTSE